MWMLHSHFAKDAHQSCYPSIIMISLHGPHICNHSFELLAQHVQFFPN